MFDVKPKRNNKSNEDTYIHFTNYSDGKNPATYTLRNLIASGFHLVCSNNFIVNTS